MREVIYEYPSGAIDGIRINSIKRSIDDTMIIELTDIDGLPELYIHTADQAFDLIEAIKAAAAEINWKIDT